MKFPLLASVVLSVGIGLLPMVTHAAEWPVSASESDIQIKTLVPADGYSKATVLIIVRDKLNRFLEGKKVMAQFSRSSGELVMAEKTTDAMGRTEFTVQSTEAGTVQVTAIVDGIRLNKEPVISFIQPPECPLGMSRNISLMGADARETTYLYGRDCTRHAFPEHAYESWHETTPSDVQPISGEVMAGIKLGASVSYRPGTLIRFQDSPRVYVASAGGVLRPLANEAAARSIFGDTWAKKVRVISVGYFITSVFGREINGPEDTDSLAGSVGLSAPGV